MGSVCVAEGPPTGRDGRGRFQRRSVKKTAETKKRKPTHGIYNVTGDGEEARWNKIGAAWTHRNSKGFSLSLEYLHHLAGGRLVIRAFPADEVR
jgi:hypothetical protein